MIHLFETLILGLFAAAVSTWLAQIWNTRRTFSRAEKIRAVCFVAAFLLSFFPMLIENNKTGAVLCVIGLVISEWTAAVVFYETYKDLEIPYE